MHSVMLEDETFSLPNVGGELQQLSQSCRANAIGCIQPDLGGMCDTLVSTSTRRMHSRAANL